MTSLTAWFDPGPGEPYLGPFAPRPLGGLLPAGHGRLVVLIDGRGGAGKSTLAAALAGEASRSGRLSAVVATDDVAWHHSRFGWHDLLVTHIIEPFLAGEVAASAQDQAAVTRFWDDWQTEERPFLASQRPWDLADLAVLGTAGEAGPSAGQVPAADGARD